MIPNTEGKKNGLFAIKEKMQIDETAKSLSSVGDLQPLNFTRRAPRGLCDTLHIKCVHGLFLGNYMAER